MLEPSSNTLVEGHGQSHGDAKTKFPPKKWQFPKIGGCEFSPQNGWFLLREDPMKKWMIWSFLEKIIPPTRVRSCEQIFLSHCHYRKKKVPLPSDPVSSEGTFACCFYHTISLSFVTFWSHMLHPSSWSSLFSPKLLVKALITFPEDFPSKIDVLIFLEIFGASLVSLVLPWTVQLFSTQLPARHVKQEARNQIGIESTTPWYTPNSLETP